MKLGLIARSDPRGLGNQTRAVHDHLHPHRTLVVDLGDLGRGYPTHPDWYPNATTLPFDGFRLPELEVRAWLEGLDAVYTAETPYDHRLPTWCRQQGVALIVHLNPEFDHWTGDPTNPRPDTFWSATTWRQGHHPVGTRIVPMPVAANPRARLRDGTGGLLHVVGRRAMADRNGTNLIIRGWRHTRIRQRWTITTQDRLPMARPPRTIDLHLSGPLDDPGDLYDLGDVLVMPRRYGGLCLPVQEAMAAGIPAVMPSVSPNLDWPVVPVQARPAQAIRTAAGHVITHQVNPRDLQATVDRLIVNPGEIAALSARAAQWAAEHSWEALGPLWWAELERAIYRARAA